MSLAIEQFPSVAANGKFFRQRGQKFFLKAMRLDGAKEPLDFSRKLALRKRFDELREAHTTGLVLTEAEAEPLLGLAAQSGLYALVEIEARASDLFSNAGFRCLLSRIVHTVNVLRGHRALIGYLVDCAVEPDALRSHGLERLKRRLRKLLRMMRRSDDSRLIALKHRPATVGLALREEDVIYAAMPALSPLELRNYVIRLHNLAEARPVVLEFSEELPGQDELVACAFGLGAAGVVAPAMRPAASSGLLGIRMLSAGELLPFVTLNGSCPPIPGQTPMVSVVICAYNAERTMRACLESLRRLEHPNYEIIIVDDGSRDRTAEIAADFPQFRLIRQPNKGLSTARNVGMQAARGDLVAYTDSDCVVDPHWLTLTVRAMVEGGFDGCGGPNYAPHEEGWREACVAASPGAPCHVLTDHDRAEHLAGCNMVFRKSTLLKVGGFDPQFTAAGDDVDICWRLLDAGFTLGFCPAAFVWHFRRNTVKAYYGQQCGYGKAEAMLYPKYPHRFNALGQIKWRGTIPGLARTVPVGSQERVAWTRRHADFQQVHEAQLSILKVLPMTAEWNLAALAVLAGSYAAGLSLTPALIMLMLGPVWALHYASQAPLEKCHKGILGRLFIALLAYTGPIARTLARYRYRRVSRTGVVFDRPRQQPLIEWQRRTLRLAYWNEAGTTRDGLLERIRSLYTRIGNPAITEAGWNDFDLKIAPDRWTRIQIKTADEEHEGGRLKTHVAARVRLSALTRTGLGLCALSTIASIALGYALVAFAIGALSAGAAVCAMSEMVESGRLAYRVIEQCAIELGLTPLGAPTAFARRAAGEYAPLAAKPRNSAEAAQPAGR